MSKLPMMTRVASLLSVVLITGCMNGPAKNTNCEWPANHPVRPLALSASSDARHLADDAQTAEDLAIRHADASRGRARRGGLLGDPNVVSYQAVREQCKASLFAIVARQHGVTDAAVATAVADRREWLDALVMLSFAVVFAIVAQQLSVFMLRGAIADSRALAASMFLMAALAAGGVGLLAGNVWFGLIESIRVGNGHMSYRAQRIPIQQHRAVAFGALTVLFAAVSAHQYRKTRG